MELLSLVEKLRRLKSRTGSEITKETKSLPEITKKTDHGRKSTHPRSDVSQARFRRTPWAEKRALVLTADETTWPACLFILDLLMKQIIKLEKQEDHRTTTSKASPLMKSFTSDNDDFRFHHYFDLVGGTSTGGLLAIMLGRLRLSLEEVSKEMSEVLEPFDSKSSSRQDRARQIRAKLNDRMKSETLKPPLQSCIPLQDVCRENASQFASIPGMCQTLVFGARSTSPSKVFILRSYRQPASTNQGHKHLDENKHLLPLVDVCRVSVANPSYKEYVNVHLDATKSAEGMTGTPTKEFDYHPLIEEEIKLLHGETSFLQYLFEIGSQPKKPASRWLPCLPFERARSVDHFLEAKGDVSAEGRQHLRISGLKELANCLRNQSRAEAERYCLDQGLGDKLESCAQSLVKARRARASTFNWETFAFTDRYMCSVCRKEGPGPEILDEPAFFDHVDFVHDFYDLEPPEMFKIQEESWMKF
ncbi:hypothetical protein D6D27_06452 [Aureobasidium pullulans]|nr:hypothetical protein D6D27_06452 [Aureobasidium pullulans]